MMGSTQERLVLEQPENQFLEQLFKWRGTVVNVTTKPQCCGDLWSLKAQASQLSVRGNSMTWNVLSPLCTDGKSIANTTRQVFRKWKLSKCSLESIKEISNILFVKCFDNGLFKDINLILQVSLDRLDLFQEGIPELYPTSCMTLE